MLEVVQRDDSRHRPLRHRDRQRVVDRVEPAERSARCSRCARAEADDGNPNRPAARECRYACLDRLVLPGAVVGNARREDRVVEPADRAERSHELARVDLRATLMPASEREQGDPDAHRAILVVRKTGTRERGFRSRENP